MFGYSLNYLIDMKAAVIVDVEATPTRITKEVDAARTMVERAEECFDLKPDHLAGDTACACRPTGPSAQVVAMHRNGWSRSIGIAGRDGRNAHGVRETCTKAAVTLGFVDCDCKQE